MAVQHRDLPFLDERHAAEDLPARSRIGAMAASLARMSSCDSQAMVTMHRPDFRSAIIDMPMQPGMAWTAGITSSRTNSMPASMERRSGLERRGTCVHRRTPWFQEAAPRRRCRYSQILLRAPEAMARDRCRSDGVGPDRRPSHLGRPAMLRERPTPSSVITAPVNRR